jgi:hypothetical protein
MYELCLLKKEQKEENEELSKIIHVEKSKKSKNRKECWKYTQKSFTPQPELTTILTIFKRQHKTIKTLKL